MIKATVAGAVLACALAGSALAGDTILGVWQPYSNPVLSLGALTIGSGTMRYAGGGSAKLTATGVPGVFALSEAKGAGFDACGPAPIRFIAFHLMGGGQLAVLSYQTEAPKAAAKGQDITAAIDTGGPACSVMVYGH